MFGCEYCIHAKIIHLSFLPWRDCHLRHLKYRSHNAQKRSSGELSSRLFETYKNTVRPHGYHIYHHSTDMHMAKKISCTSQHHRIPQWTFLLR